MLWLVQSISHCEADGSSDKIWREVCAFIAWSLRFPEVDCDPQVQQTTRRVESLYPLTVGLLAEILAEKQTKQKQINT